MCLICDIFGIPSQPDYIEVSAGALKDSTVTVFGMVAQIPPAQVILGPTGFILSTLFYN